MNTALVHENVIREDPVIDGNIVQRQFLPIAARPPTKTPCPRLLLSPMMAPINMDVCQIRQSLPIMAPSSTPQMNTVNGC